MRRREGAAPLTAPELVRQVPEMADELRRPMMLIVKAVRLPAE